MRDLLTGVLTVFMVVDCLLLILLVLLQLPKKEAGAGLAFGGAATDALFGAGSGNVLTKITKWVAVFFFVLAIVLAVSAKPNRSGSSLAEKLGTAKPAPVSSVPATPAGEKAAPVSNAEKSVAPAPVTAPATNK